MSKARQCDRCKTAMFKNQLVGTSTVCLTTYQPMSNGEAMEGGTGFAKRTNLDYCQVCTPMIAIKLCVNEENDTRDEE